MPGGATYATVAEVREEGFGVEDHPTARVTLALERATRYIDEVTGRWFVPRDLTLTFDGSGGPILFPQMPVIAVTRLRINDPFGGGFVTIDRQSFRYYARHLTDGMVDPDDRDNPRIEFLQPVLPSFGSGFFPPRQKAIEVEGTFGYTDPDEAGLAAFRVAAAAETLTFDAAARTITRSDGSFVTDNFVAGMRIQVWGAGVANDGGYTVLTVSATVLTMVVGTVLTDQVVTVDSGEGVAVYSHGQVPNQIKWACIAIASAKFLVRLADRAKLDDQLKRWRMTGQRSGSRGITMQEDHRRGAFTGDPEIDIILARYRQPPHVGAIGPSKFYARRRPITK